MQHNLTEANATVILSYLPDMIMVWTTPKNDPIVLNFAHDEPCRFCLTFDANWNEVLRDLEENIANGWTASKWPAEWGDWKRHART